LTSLILGLAKNISYFKEHFLSLMGQQCYDTLFIVPAFNAGIAFAVLTSVHYVQIPSGQRIHESRR